MFRIIDGECRACGDLCASCDSNGKCLSCVDNAKYNADKSDCECNGYFYKTSDNATATNKYSCAACGKGCVECTKTACTTCIAKTVTPPTGVDCTCLDPNAAIASNQCVCKDTYFSDAGSGKCVLCGSAGCTKCADGSEANAGTAACECKAGYTKVSTDPAPLKCDPVCSTNCGTCSTPTDCSDCVSGYKLENKACTTCDLGYTKIDGTCKQCDALC
jgi:hypothetical protein